ncbi:MAG TPA: hypothetical protein V6C99_05135 [Oculatellaceae cyanobacterium]|jgi:hypothetical protein
MGNIGPQFNAPKQLFQPMRRTAEPASPQPEQSRPPQAQQAASLTGGMPLSPHKAGLLQNTLTPAQMALLLRNLLQLPAKMVQLLAMLTQTESASVREILKALTENNVQIPPEAFEAFLSSRGQQGKETLIKMMQNTLPGSIQADQSLGELLKALSKLSDNATSQHFQAKSGMEAMHTILSLYLPGYPLQPPQQFVLRRGQPGEGEGDEKKTKPEASAESLAVFLKTIHLGALKVSITYQAGALEVLTAHRLPETLERELEQAMRDSLEAEHLPKAHFLMLGQSGQIVAELDDAKAPPQNHPAGQEVRILPGQGVSAIAFIAAYAVIRAVFELDNRLQLRETRQVD